MDTFLVLYFLGVLVTFFGGAVALRKGWKGFPPLFDAEDLEPGTWFLMSMMWPYLPFLLLVFGIGKLWMKIAGKKDEDSDRKFYM